MLKSIRHEGFTETHESTLTVWDHQLSEAGSRLLRARLEMVAALRPHVEKAYQQLSGSVRTARMVYESSFEQQPPTGQKELAELMLTQLQAARKQERERAITLVGPHRDDILFSLDDVPVKGYASHGETWSYALSLRLGAYRVMVDDDPSEGAQPILILDDVFAELDARRRRRLAELAGEAEQLIVTAAVDDDVPETLLANAWRVESVEQISRVSPLESDVESPAPSADSPSTPSPTSQDDDAS